MVRRIEADILQASLWNLPGASPILIP